MIGFHGIGVNSHFKFPLLQSIVRARSQSGSKSGSQKRKPKVYVENAAERIRAVEGNNYCSDCSSPSK